MGNATGHTEGPGAGPHLLKLVNPFTGIANLYYRTNPVSGKHEIVKPNPSNIGDEVLSEFDTYEQAMQWFHDYCQRTKSGR